MVELKPKKLIYCTILLTGILSLTVPMVVNSSEAMSFDSYYSQISEKHQKSLWDVGDNLDEGDYFSYRICDGTIPETFISSHCYNIQLTFVSLLESSNGSVWIVQGILTTSTEERFLILHIDPDTFEVDSDVMNLDLAESLEKTIFSLASYKNKSLKIGNVWDSIDSYFTNDVSLEIKKSESVQFSFGVVETFVLGYDVVTSSSHFINSDFPFPLLATIYSPNIIFPEPLELYSYEILEYGMIDADTNQLISSTCLNEFEIESNENFNNFFLNSKNSSNATEVFP
mgnify:CR=1 FL=1